MLSGKTFMVTGATGRLGCEVVARLERLGATVIPLVFAGYPAWPKRVEWTAESAPRIINGSADLKRVPVPDYVINLHWCVDRTLDYDQQVFFEIERNIRSLDFFWKWLKESQVNHIVNISSIKVYGSLNEGEVSAKDMPLPTTPYGVSKLFGEKFFDGYFFKTRTRVTHLRLCSIASIGENPNQLMTQLFEGAFKGKEIKIYENNTVNLLYIDDAIDLIINAGLLEDGKVYNLVANDMYVKEVVQLFEKNSKKITNITRASSDEIKEKISFVSDIEKIKTAWSRETSVCEMIKIFIEPSRK